MLSSLYIKIKRFSIRWPVAFKFFIAFFFFLLYQKKIRKKSEYLVYQYNFYHAFKAVLKSIIVEGDPGKTKIYYCSLPLSHELNIPVTYTADSYNLFRWHELMFLKRGLKESNSFPLISSACYLCLFAELLMKKGFYSLGYSIYLWLSQNRNKSYQVMGLLGLLDVTSLFIKWNHQLNSFKEKGTWFDSDKSHHSSDELSFLFNIGTENTLDDLYLKLQQLSPKHIMTKFIYADFLIMTNRHKEALSLFEYISKEIPSNIYIKEKISHLNAFLFGSINTSYITVNTIKFNSFCLKYNQKPTVIETPKKVSFNYEYYFGTRQFINEVDCLFDPVLLLKINNAFELGSLVGGEYEGTTYLFTDSHPLNHASFKMFNRLTLLYDDDKALMIKKQSTHCESAFFIQGNGWSYYHWLVETIPFLLIYKKMINNSIPLYFSFNLKQWHRDSLALLGLGNVQVLPVLPGKRRTFNTLFIASFESVDTVSTPSSILKIRQSLAKSKEIKVGKRFYITRKPTQGVRKLANECDIISLLTQFGFILVDPSDYSISEQIELFADVEAIVGEGGAAFSNLIFCPDKTKVLCLTSERGFYTSFSSISSAIGQDLSYAVSASRVIPSPYFMWCSRLLRPDVDQISMWLHDKLL